jgi:hypothetical protein
MGKNLPYFSNPLIDENRYFTSVWTSVSNPVYTDTGIPVFGTPNTDTNTGKTLPVFAGIENE